jgi:hypothetical protein
MVVPPRPRSALGRFAGTRSLQRDNSLYHGRLEAECVGGLGGGQPDDHTEHDYLPLDDFELVDCRGQRTVGLDSERSPKRRAETLAAGARAR